MKILKGLIVLQVLGHTANIKTRFKIQIRAVKKTATFDGNKQKSKSNNPNFSRMCK